MSRAFSATLLAGAALALLAWTVARPADPESDPEAVEPGRVPVSAATATISTTTTTRAISQTITVGAKIRGVTISTHRGGQEWASDQMAPVLREIREVGGNWVAIHPYARIDADGSVRFRPIDPAHPPEEVARPIREAHALGLKILIKPHLAYWGSPFSWRGEIDFSDDAAWQRFWSGYRQWIVELAAASAAADGFAVGTELDRTLRFEAEWRALIGEVRRRTGAELTYAANWTDYQRVPFWDTLDQIGIQAYFPVSEEPTPSGEALRRGWQANMATLRAFSELHQRPIVFTELGYNRSFAAAARPWDYTTDGPEAEPFQAACLRAALEAIAAEPRVAGVFLWKWFPGPRSASRNFQLTTPQMRGAIRDAWLR
jgi:hypothetical protein